MRNHIVENIIILLKQMLNKRKNSIIKNINAIIFSQRNVVVNQTYLQNIKNKYAETN
jgi:hypothetical protein